MKRSLNKKNAVVQPQVEVDVAGLINKIQEHLFSLERKMDTLINRSSVQSTERHFEHPQRNDRERQGGFRERNFYKVICADCKRECEVPFKPGPDRPVYCKECFSRRKNCRSLFIEKQNKVPIEKDKIQESCKKKKPFSVKRKKRL